MYVVSYIEFYSCKLQINIFNKRVVIFLSVNKIAIINWLLLKFKDNHNMKNDPQIRS